MSQPRNLIIFADGTGQDGGSKENTNVYKMFCLAEDRTDQQVCYYHAGVGTNRIGKYLGLGTGLGFGRNVRACYDFLHEEYRAGDRIFLIGFSRGAATVRSLAYFIHLFGILARARKTLIDRAWRIYTIRDAEKRRAAAKEFVEYNPTMWTKVHFVGCFDTVAALGAPYQWASRVIDRLPGCKHRFHNMRLSPSIVHAYHALALDDMRKTFHPLLWDPIESDRERVLDDPQLEPLACETLKQVWFLGMHTDVGGGYRDPQLSDIPLVWMTSMAVKHGFRVHNERLSIAENPNGTMHDSRNGMWRVYRKLARSWPDGRADVPLLHASANTRTLDVRNTEKERYRAWLNEHKAMIEPWVRYSRGLWTTTRPAEAIPPAPDTIQR